MKQHQQTIPSASRDTYEVETKALNRAAKRNEDRFLILDGTEGYLVGASLKDAGKESFAVAKLEDSAIVDSIVATLGK